MSKTMYKVKTIEDNQLFPENTINNRLKKAMLVSFLDPSVSIPYLQMTNVDEETLNKFLSDKLECEIPSELIISNAVNDICVTSEQSIEREDSSGLTIVNLGKKVIEDKVLSRQIENPEAKMSVEDLMAKLYGNNEESKGLGK